jgi:lysozyme
MTPDNLIDQLVRDEGEINHAYQDSRGFWTIGSGICIDQRAGCGITHEENLYLLGNRVALAESQVRTQIPFSISLDPVRRAVLENMAFNEGIAHLLGFKKMLAAIQAGDWETAAAEGLDSEWAHQVGSRANRLMQQLKTGQWV